MSTNHEKHLAKSCWFKYKYVSKKEALDHGKIYNQENNKHVAFNAYKCEYCNRWHLTSKQGG